MRILINNHIAAIVGDRLFFSSANYTFDDEADWKNTSSLYWLPLNNTFNVNGPIDMSLIGEGPLPSTVLVGGMNPVAGGFSGTFFYDHTTLYAYAGMVGEEADGINNSLWSYDTTMNKWSLVEVEGGRISFGNNSEGVHASDPKSGLSFYTGGWAMASNGTNNGTVKFESSNPGTPQWSFMTTQNGIQGPNILKGAMVYVRKGQSGVLIAFGGYNTAYKGDQFASGWDWNQRSLKDVYVYDIFSNTWYLQEASGDIPEHRSDFCAGVSSAPDDSSFQITIHAGWDLFEGIALSDVYTLSIPSFRWIKVVDSDNPDTILEPHAGRQRLKCDVWNERQMIVFGGFVQSEEKHFNDACNESYPPFKVLDTSTYSWRTQFDPRLEYSVPKVVTEVIGGKYVWRLSNLLSVFTSFYLKRKKFAVS